MSQSLINVAYIGATILFILALGGLSQQETARRGIDVLGGRVLDRPDRDDRHVPDAALDVARPPRRGEHRLEVLVDEVVDVDAIEGRAHRALIEVGVLGPLATADGLGLTRQGRAGEAGDEEQAERGTQKTGRLHGVLCRLSSSRKVKSFFLCIPY